MNAKNGTAGEAIHVELPPSILQVIAQAASQNGEIAQRLVGFLEGGGYSVENRWTLLISSAAMIESQPTTQKVT